VLANAKERGHVVDEGVFRVKAPRRDQPEMRFLDWDEVYRAVGIPRAIRDSVLLAAEELLDLEVEPGRRAHRLE
jgi:hypothetical protein